MHMLRLKFTLEYATLSAPDRSGCTPYDHVVQLSMKSTDISYLMTNSHRLIDTPVEGYVSIRTR